MFHTSILPEQTANGDVAMLLDQLAHCSSRPRYAFMVLNLIAQVARSDGSAGPVVARQAGGVILLRDWLCDSLTPMGRRDPKRKALAQRIVDELRGKNELPADEAAALIRVEDEIRERVRASGKTNVSRAVSELVGAGLLQRHYQGYRVDHHNRGAQRQAVYTLVGAARSLLPARPDSMTIPIKAKPVAAQSELPF
jgi:hypothetical protein